MKEEENSNKYKHYNETYLFHLYELLMVFRPKTFYCINNNHIELKYLKV
jgi:hypothetical protein